jgi:hypothetical protein
LTITRWNLHLLKDLRVHRTLALGIEVAVRRYSSNLRSAATARAGDPGIVQLALKFAF